MEPLGAGYFFRVSSGLPSLMFIPPLRHTHLSLHPEVCDNIGQAAHYNTINLLVLASTLTGQRVRKFVFYTFMYVVRLFVNNCCYGEESSFRLWLVYMFPPDRLCGLVVRVSGYRSRGPGFDSRRYKIFWEVGCLERGPLSLVRKLRRYLNEKVAAPVPKAEINGRRNSLRWPRNTLYPQKLALT
jgi:hypothetical protein